MKANLPLICGLLIVALISGCSPGGEKEEKSSGAEKAKPEERVKRGTNGQVVITLDRATQRTMGLATAVLERAELPAQVKGYGRVLDIAPLASQVVELSTARAASAASQAELKRLETLAAQDNASQRALQAAQAAAVRDQAQAEAAHLRLLTAWGSAIAEQKDLPAFVQTLSTLSNVIAELDLVASEFLPARPTGARLFTLADSTNPIPAQLLGPAPTVDPQMQSRGFLLLVTPNSAHLAPGASLTGFLTLAGEAQTGVALPYSAVVHYNGAAWTYLQTSETTFARTEVRLEQTLGAAWFLHGLKAGDKVVSVGAQQLLSEELNTSTGD